MIICPACGSSVEGQLSLGCPECGARAVGPPLAKPEHELVSFSPAVLTIAVGVLLPLGFFASTLVVWITKVGAVPRFGAVVIAGEVAAWQLKWVALPIAIGAVWITSKSLRTIRKTPNQFGGLRIARAGYCTAIAIILIVGTLIGITVPERLQRRQWAFEATENARAYAVHRALMEYRNLHGTLPPRDDWVQQLRTLPDPDGSIAEALNYVDINGYEATSVMAAAAPKTKPLPRGAALRDASLTTTPDPPAVSFTNYNLRLPGTDKKLNTDDDLIVHDGLVMTVPEFAAYRLSRSSAP